MTRHILLASLLLAAVPGCMLAQGGPDWDNSGNNLLNGVFNFRQVVWVVGDDSGNLDRSVALYGTIQFDGAGAYTLTGSVIDSDVGNTQTYTTSGTYSIAASGYGFISSPVVDEGRVYGLVARGIFLGSSTEEAINDLFVAARASTAPPGVGSFNGTYQAVEMRFPNLSIRDARNASYRLNANGTGGIAGFTATGHRANSRNLVTQTLSGVSYSFANGVGRLDFGGTLTESNLIAGEQRIHLSADGDFLFGGSPDGANMIFGVRALPAGPSPDLSGLFYQNGMDLDTSDPNDGILMNTYYGSFNSANGTKLGHQRLLPGFDEFPFDYTYYDDYTVGVDGVYEDFLGFRNFLGANGNIQVGFGQAPTLGITVSVKAPEFTGSGVFVNPAGLVNAASSSPFTTGISRGEFVSLYGSNLAPRTEEAAGFSTSVAGVQVFVNDRPAPIRLVSSGLINFVIPWGTVEGVARIRVANNGTQSNAVTTFVNRTTPGVFTIPAGGVGYAAALRGSELSLVSAQNPARPGETIAVYLTGLGDVSPAVVDATPGPTNPLSLVTSPISAFVDGEEAPISFAGLAPTLIGLYQINLQIPAGIAPGDVFLDVSGPDSYNSQAQLPIGAAGATALEAGTVESERSATQLRRGRTRGRPAVEAGRVRSLGTRRR